MSMCLIAGDVNLEYVVKVVPVRFLHRNGTTFPLQLTDLLKLYAYRVSLQTLAH